MSFRSAAGLLVMASARNRLRRLIKQPRYLVFTLFGVLYLAAIAGPRWLLNPRTAGTQLLGVDPSHPSPFLVLCVGLAVFAYLGSGWVLGGSNVALQYTEAEVQFFFAGPVSRRALVHYKLVRMLLGALLTGPFFAVLLRRGGHPVYASVGFFLALSTLSLHGAAASLTRASLIEHGISALKRRIVTLGVMAAVIGGLAWSIAGVQASLPRPDDGADAWIAAMKAWAEANEHALSWALFPVVAMMRVTTATTAAQLLAALPAAVAIVAVHYAWASSTSVAFEEAAAEAATKRAAQLQELARTGRLGRIRRGRPLFRLGSRGAPWVAIFWKNCVASTRASPRMLAGFAVIVVAATLGPVVAFSATRRDPNAVVEALGTMAFGVAVTTALFGPHAVRNDLRHDIDRMDVLRSYPMTGTQVVLGEVLAPLATLAAIEWLLLTVGTVLFVTTGSKGAMTTAAVAASTCALMLPALTAGGLLLRNLVVLVLPSWAASSAQETRGLELVGLRLLLLVGTLVALIVVLFPAGAVAGLVWLALGHVLGMAVAPLAGLLGAVVVTAESAAMVALLGWAFDRFEVSQP